MSQCNLYPCYLKHAIKSPSVRGTNYIMGPLQSLLVKSKAQVEFALAETNVAKGVEYRCCPVRKIRLANHLGVLMILTL